VKVFLRKEIFHISGNFITRIIISFVDLAAGIIIARSLGPEGKGNLYALRFWPAILVWLGGLSIGGSNTYFSAREREKIPSLLANSLIFSIVLGGIILLFSEAFVYYLFHDKRYIFLARIVLLTIPFSLFSDYAIWIFNGIKNYMVFNLLRFLPRFFYFAFVMFFFLKGKLEIQPVILSFTGVQIFMGFLTFVLVAGLVCPPSRWKKDSFLMKEQLSMGLKMHLGVFTQIGNKRADQALLISFFDPKEIGLYSVAVNISEFLLFLSHSIGLTIVPSTAPLERERAVRRIKKYALGSLFFLIIFSLFLYFISPWVIKFLYGEAFLPALLPLRILLLAHIGWSIGNIFDQGLKSLKLPLYGSIAGLISFVFNLAFLLLLLPPLKITGAAIASLIGYFVYFLANYVFFIRTAIRSNS